MNIACLARGADGAMGTPGNSDGRAGVDGGGGADRGTGARWHLRRGKRLGIASGAENGGPWLDFASHETRSPPSASHLLAHRLPPCDPPISPPHQIGARNHAFLTHATTKAITPRRAARRFSRSRLRRRLPWRDPRSAARPPARRTASARFCLVGPRPAPFSSSFSPPARLHPCMSPLALAADKCSPVKSTNEKGL